MGMSGNVSAPLSVIILTYDEEVNIARCLESLKEVADEIFIADSFSTDRTVEIAKAYTQQVYQNPFRTQAQQFNWALDNLPIKNEWIMRIDADERVTPELAEEIRSVLPKLPDEICAVYVKRRMFFMGKWIKHGGLYPAWSLRIFRKEMGRCEERYMDEYVVVHAGRTKRLKHDIIDENAKGLDFWISKHTSFATREMMDILQSGRGMTYLRLTGHARRKRWLKERVYLRLPLFIRCVLYFLYRYFVRFGILDGRAGLVYHVSQGLWYRLLVDAKIFERRERKDLQRTGNERVGRWDDGDVRE